MIMPDIKATKVSRQQIRTASPGRHIAAEDFHGGDAQAQGKEGLVHGGHDHIADADLRGPLKVRYQIEFHALHSAVQGQAVDGQNDDQCQQADHHPLADPLQPLLQTEAAHDEARQHDDYHIERHLAGIGQHIGPDCVYIRGLHAAEGAGGELEAVTQHPAGDRGVVHHQQAAPDYAQPAVDVPAAALGLQGLVAQHGALAAGTAHRQLHGQNGNPHDDQGDDVEQHEYAAAVDTGDVGEFPHIADADGAAGAYQNESQPGSEIFATQTSLSFSFSHSPKNSADRHSIS